MSAVLSLETQQQKQQQKTIQTKWYTDMNRYLTEEDIQMAKKKKNTHKRCSTLLAIRNRKLIEMSQDIPIRTAKIKFKSDTPNTGKIQRNCVSHICWWECKMVHSLWKLFEKGSLKMHLLCSFKKCTSELYYEY